eukprot:4898264-Prymnesium_polylepis.1
MMHPPSRARGAWVRGATWVPGRSFAAAHRNEGGWGRAERDEVERRERHARAAERARAAGR